MQHFVELYEILSETIVYFEAEETGSIDSKPEDLWQIEVYLDHQPNLEELTKQVEVLATELKISPPILTCEIVNDRDWVSEVQKTFIPINAGCFFIHHSGFQDNIPEDKIAIEVNAGRAFGTGEHETTSNCLLALTELKNDNFTNCLDMGCGSGILAIAMAKLWQSNIAAVDLDEQAVLVTQENIKLNNVAFVKTSQSNGYDSDFVKSHGPYKIITANILAMPLIAMAPDAYNNVAKDGILIIAGFLKDQVENVLNAHLKQGFKLVKEICTENWPTLILKKD